MPRPLAVIPAADDQAFAAAGRVNFATALPALLERLGFGAWDSCEPAEVDADTLAGRPLVVVAYTPTGLWPHSATRALAEHHGPMLMEGPMDETLVLQIFGLVDDGEIPDFRGRVALLPTQVEEPPRRGRRRKKDVAAPDRLGAALDLALRGTALPDGATRFEPLWARAVTRETPVTRADLADTDSGRIALAYLDAAAGRLVNPRSFVRQPRLVLRAALLFARAALLLGDSDSTVATFAPWRYRTTEGVLMLVGEALAGGETLDPVAVGALIASRGASDPAPDLRLDALETLLPDVTALIAAGAAYAERNDPGDLPAYRALAGQLVDHLLPEAEEGEVAFAAAGTRRRTQRYRDLPVANVALRKLAAAAAMADLAGRDLVVVPAESEGMKPVERLEAEGLRVLDMSTLSSSSPESRPSALEAAGALADRIEGLEEVSPVALASSAEAAASIGAVEAERRLVARARGLLDEESGLLAGETGVNPDPGIGASFLAVAAAEQEGLRGCSRDLVERWRRGPAALQRLVTVDADSAKVLLAARTDGEEETLPFLFKDGSRVGTAFPLFSWLVAEHAPPPPALGTACSFRPAADARSAALAVLEACCADAGIPRRIAWPWPAQIGATVVHDVKQPRPRRALVGTLSWEADRGIASTYFFSPAAPQTPLRSLLQELGHEIALVGKVARHLGRDAEALRSWAEAPVVGWSGTFRFHGPGMLLQADEAGFEYFLMPWHPASGFPMPLGLVDGKDGSVRLLELDGIDLENASEAETVLSERGHLCLMPAAAQPLAAKLRGSAWWAPIASAVERARLVAAVRTEVVDDAVEVSSDAPVPGLQLVLGTRPGFVPCLGTAGSPASERLAEGAAGTYAFDLAPRTAVRIQWIAGSEAPDAVAAPTEPEGPPATLAPVEIESRLEETGIRLPSELEPEAVPALLADEPSKPDRGAAVAGFIAAAYDMPLEGRTLLEIAGSPEVTGLSLLVAEGMASLRAYVPFDAEGARLRERIAEVGVADAEVHAEPFDTLRLEPAEADVVLMTGLGGQPPEIVHALFDQIGQAVRKGGVVVVHSSYPHPGNGPDPLSHLDVVRRLRSAGFEELRYVGSVGSTTPPDRHWLHAVAPEFYVGARRPERNRS